jgi:hypothetical protein
MEAPVTAVVLAVAGIVLAVALRRDREASRRATVGELAAARATIAARLRRFDEERAVRFVRYEQAWSRAGVRPRPLYLTGWDGRRTTGG